MQALIRYWTGTGNTARAAGLVAATLAEAGWEVDAQEVRFDSPVPTADELSKADWVVVGCPTLGFGPPVHFLRWLRRWPSGPARVAVLALGGATAGPGGIVPGFTAMAPGLVARALGPGRVVTSFDASYPVNWTQVIEPPDAATAATLRADADPRVVAWARKLASGEALPPVPRGLHRLALWPVTVLFRLVARRFLGKLLVADGGCTGCGLCAQGCPAGVIRLVGGRPRWSLDCDACNRCINQCPVAAIQVSLVRVVALGVGNLALVAAALGLGGSWGIGPAVALFVGGSVLQLTLVDRVLSWCEARVGGGWIAWGWTKTWRRYR